LRFDAVGSLLYVDRRGAPENRQLGLDATGKLRLLRAIAETAKNARGRSWIAEVNWPLREGPTSPAGRRMGPLAQRPVDLRDPGAAAGVLGRLGDRAEQAELAGRIEAELPVFRRPPAIDVEEASDGVEAQALRAQVEHRGGRVQLEVDHRRTEQLDVWRARRIRRVRSARSASPQDLPRDPGQLDVLAQRPDAPLAPVDRLADLEAAAVG